MFMNMIIKIYSGNLLPRKIFYMKGSKKYYPCDYDKETFFEAMPIKWINQSRRVGRSPLDA